MNDRIDGLIEQSYIEVQHDRDWDATNMVFHKKKFAELLIKECCSIVMADKVISWTDSIRICDNIKEEFGVEK